MKRYIPNDPIPTGTALNSLTKQGYSTSMYAY